MKEDEVHNLLLGQFKDIYADLVAVTGKKPIQILYEFDAILWHLAVAHSSPDLYDSNVEKAMGHLQRASLDTVKLLWLHYKDRVEFIINDEDMRTYCVNYSEKELFKLYDEAEAKSIEARRSEHANVGKSPTQSLSLYHEAASLYRQVWKRVDARKVVKFQRFRTRHIIRKNFVGFIAGVLSSALVTALFWALGA